MAERRTLTAAAELAIESLSLDEYVEQVLPHSAELWASGRSLKKYAADLREFARTAYCRRSLRLFGLRENGVVTSSCKRYARELRCGKERLAAAGIGAIFTRPDYRRRGLATTLVAALLDAERGRGTDVAFLFSDIHPRFYEQLGFIALPSRRMTIRAGALEFERIEPGVIGESDWPAVARCFDALERRRSAALRRTPSFWESIRRHSAPERTLNLAIRNGSRIVAYCLGRRVVRNDAYHLDEVAFSDERHGALVAPLLRAAAGDLAKIVGWLPPERVRDVLPRASISARKDAILMIAPLSSRARASWRRLESEILSARGDPAWANDHI
ncbi:MAG: GNAT family N-acetyltransferase [Candidatus Eremiobacteraeota bacterium]|nr:GNAT family N-acetyltransferase [Candidatus Eremiobacteraeota bacterium]